MAERRSARPQASISRTDSARSCSSTAACNAARRIGPPSGTVKRTACPSSPNDTANGLPPSCRIPLTGRPLLLAFRWRDAQLMTDALAPSPELDAPIRVILADDHPILRSGLRLLLGAEPDLEVVGEANNGLEAVEQTTRLRPDVVVMDIAMPGMSGLEATRRISQLETGARVLILTVHAEEQYLLPVVQAGGSGYVLKSQADTDLLEAIRAVHRGEVFLDPPAQKMLLEDYLDRVKAGKEVDSYQTLSEREREVLKLTAEGYTAQEIADRLVLSPKTVDTYRQRVMDKLNLHHRAELVKYALRKGLLQPGEG